MADNSVKRIELKLEALAMQYETQADTVTPATEEYLATKISCLLNWAIEIEDENNYLVLKI